MIITTCNASEAGIVPSGVCLYACLSRLGKTEKN